MEHNSFNSNHWELSSYINAKGNYTSYLYTRRNSRFDFFSKNNPNTNQFACDNYNYTLKRITYPTGYYSYYTYDPYLDNMGEDGCQIVYRVSIHKYKVSNVVYNQVTYSYADGGPTGYPNNYIDSNGNLQLPSSYLYYTIITDSNGNVRTIAFGNKHTLQTDELINNNATLRETIYEYNTRKLPTRKTERLYNSAGYYTELIYNWEYNTKGSVTKGWSPLAEGSLSNTQYRKTYTYDDTYNILTEFSYFDNDNNQVRQQFVLSADHKTVKKSHVYVGAVQTQLTEYTYGSYGNISSTKACNDISTNQYEQVSYQYQSGAYITKETQSGIIDADGNSVSNIVLHLRRTWADSSGYSRYGK